MPFLRRAAFALLAVVAVGCSRSSPEEGPRPDASPGPRRGVTGYITEIEFGKLSLRAVDGRSLIFELQGAPESEARLRQDMAALSPVTITYRAQSGRLLPIAIEHPCPGPDCPPPYTPPRPSGL